MSRLDILRWPDERLATREASVGEQMWPAARMRSAETPEDCLVIGDPTADPVPLSEARLTPLRGVWQIDTAVPLDGTWHGACVLSRSDGALVGILIVVDDDDVSVALLPSGLVDR